MSRRVPIGLVALQAIVASCYVIYIAVSFFHTDVFLFGLDALLGLSVLYALTSRAFGQYTTRNGLLLMTVLLYAGCALFAYVALSAPEALSAIKTLRNLLYCAAVFVVALTYVTSRDRLNSLIRIMAVLTVFAALYGLRQAIFGFWFFELERLALMGRSLQEFIFMGRGRLTSTFGDPLLCGFFMMVGLFVIRARLAATMTKQARWAYRLGGIATFAILVGSLTRAPLLGFVIGSMAMLILDFRLSRRSLARISGGVVTGVVVAALVTWIFESKVLANTGSPLLGQLQNGAESVWSLVALFSGGGDENTYFLVSQSKDARLIAWESGIQFLAENPLGAGFTNANIFEFAVVDTGLLQVALLMGVPGLFAYLLLTAIVFFRGAAHLRRLKRSEDRRVLSALLGAWVGMLVTTGISSMATTSVAAIITWLIGAALVNCRRIFSVPTLPSTVATGGHGVEGVHTS